MYGQFKEMWEKDPSEDILLNLCTMFEERKTRRQIMRKLKDMNLIQVRGTLFIKNMQSFIS